MISIETAVEYFQNHLLGEIFLESSPEQRQAALAMAELDIAGYLDRLPGEEERLFAAAVCEQAVYLLSHRESLTERKVLISETVEGLGSRSYAASGGKTAVLAPRAELYLKHLGGGKRLVLERG